MQNWFADFDLLMNKKELLVKENFRAWNPQMKSKSVDQEFNEANDGDNNSNVNLKTIVKVKIGNNNEQM